MQRLLIVIVLLCLSSAMSAQRPVVTSDEKLIRWTELSDPYQVGKRTLKQAMVMTVGDGTYLIFGAPTSEWVTQAPGTYGEVVVTATRRRPQEIRSLYGQIKNEVPDPAVYSVLGVGSSVMLPEDWINIFGLRLRRGSIVVGRDGLLLKDVENFADVFKALLQAAENGDLQSQNNIGGLYALGQGVPLDRAEAAKWLRSAADRGFAMAQFNLGALYSAVNNRVEALKWMCIATAFREGRSIDPDNDGLAVQRDAFENSMTSAQVADARIRAHHWVEEFTVNNGLGSARQSSVEQFYILKSEELSGPTVALSVIQVATRDEAESLLAQIRGGADFSQLATEHSIHFTATRTGTIGRRLPITHLRPEFQHALRALPGTGGITDIVTVTYPQPPGAAGEMAPTLAAVISQIECISSKSGDVVPLNAPRKRAIETLGDTMNPRATEALIGALKTADADASLRSEAAESLGKIGDPRAVPALIAALQHDRRVRESVATALGSFDDPLGAAALLQAMNDDESVASTSNRTSQMPSLAANAARALAKMRNSVAQQGLLAALKDLRPGMRRLASGALSRPTAVHAVESLIALLKDPDLGVRETAAESLARIGRPTVVEPLISASLADASLSEIVCRIKDPSTVDALIRALVHDNWHVQRCAAKVLGVIRDRSAVPALIATLQTGRLSWNYEQTEMVRREVISALGEIGDPRAVAPLVAIAVKERSSASDLSGFERYERLQRETWRRVASIEALKKLNDPQLTETAKAYRALIMKGDKKSEEALVAALHVYGDTTMANNYLNCGNPRLRAAAFEWVNDRGGRISTTYGGSSVRWGARK